MPFIHDFWLNLLTYLLLPSVFLVSLFQGIRFSRARTITRKLENIGFQLIITAAGSFMAFLLLDFFLLDSFNIIKNLFDLL